MKESRPLGIVEGDFSMDSQRESHVPVGIPWLTTAAGSMVP